MILRLMALALLIFWGTGNLNAQGNVPNKKKKQESTVVTTETPVSKPTPQTETVPGDPMNVQIHTLSNGMKLYMSVNRDEPRIQTNIAVRAGSKHDPAETTGLAHYLEHMLFKGTSNIGALDWEKEKVYLEQISALYEQHRQEKDPEKRKAIYAEIDRLSNEAANLVAANEYDKLVGSLGAAGTNAYTWVEQTVYVNDIPANELERWMQLESERFRQCVLRLFHTELEAVYEEFNINQDRDFRKVAAASYSTLFPTHPYGTQTTIGTAEHLKNPSHVKIQEYFTTYYVPNNMAIVLAGDFNPEEAIAWAEKYFGAYASKPVPPFTYQPQPELTEVVRKDVFGQEAEYVELSWRLEGPRTNDPLMLSLARAMMSNGKAGLIDLHLLQKQQVLEARASFTTYEDYAIFSLYGKPRQGQTLEDVEKLLLAELDSLRQGNFPDWLMEAVIKNFKLGELVSIESNGSRVGAMTNSFILGIKWADYVSRFNRMEALPKSEVLNFVKTRIRPDNYVVVYKRTGADPGVVKVEKPAITPVSLNRANTSAFAENFLGMESKKLEPVFIDYQNQIQTGKLASGIPVDYIHNPTNATFELNYILEMGKNHDPLLPIAISYLPYLGTDKYSPEELQQQFYRLGLSFNVYSSDNRVYVTLSGLDESFEQGVRLFEHLLRNCSGQQASLDNLVADIMLRRANAMKDKRVILRNAMANYARYGAENPFTDIIPEDQLRALKPEDLTGMLRQITQYDHTIFYYGSQSLTPVLQVLNKEHHTPASLLPLKPEKTYAEMATPQNQVLFVDFPMVQAEILLMSKGTPNFNLDEYLMASLYNEYFGAGLSSIVFQEIRESKALAYSAYANFGSPVFQDKAHYFQAYVGTQADKMPDAIPAMLEIINNMPVSPEQIENARQSLLRRLETERIIKSDIYWNYRTQKQRGYERDLRQDLYNRLLVVTPEELVKFQQDKVKDRTFTFLVLGSKENVNMDFLRSIGPVTELSMEQIFGYKAKP